MNYLERMELISLNHFKSIIPCLFFTNWRIFLCSRDEISWILMILSKNILTSHFHMELVLHKMDSGLQTTPFIAKMSSDWRASGLTCLLKSAEFMRNMVEWVVMGCLWCIIYCLSCIKCLKSQILPKMEAINFMKLLLRERRWNRATRKPTS